ncbi:hypothetical protein NOS3756_21050 [Nostoc sp. NIES-3756]|uniref:hypothetical protein n=1 Tax=Nostoc sp. NIES-3756 TaxID=1751286 RepID=UPI00071F6C8F|nr:hypothetical protein [Nostoc sp. NIES-3756]BAT53146.1 hypothetical protein NOS3756_21050 [Nostoc sp. NIES-3756]
MELSSANLKLRLRRLAYAIYYQLQLHRLDILIVLVLAVLAGIFVYQGSQFVNPEIAKSYTINVWFGADCPRVFDDMVHPGANHYRTKVHPLFVILTLPLVFILQRGLDISEITSVTLVIATVASLWLGTFFIILRLIGCRRFDAILFSILAMTSAASVFWFVVPETYAFGSFSILIGLCLVALTLHYSISDVWYVLVSAATFSITVTNWMVGILATLISHRWQRALQITVNAFCLVVVVWAVQKIIFPSVEFFLGDREEKQYVNMPGSGGPLTSIKSFIFHSMVMPSFNILPNSLHPNWPLMSVQHSSPGSASIWGHIAVGLWAALLGLGIWALFTIKKHQKFRIVLGLTLLGQLGLHTVYGDETFLFSLHFAPLLVILVAFSTLTRARSLALVLTGMLVITGSVNNSWQFSKVTKFFASSIPRQQVLQEMRLHPDEPWPRGVGHAVLGVPGSNEIAKAYHEPGGSFSPAVASFGVSFWLTDQAGNIKTTSDAIPISEIQQQLSWQKNQSTPGILTNTKYYQALWSINGEKSWLLHLQPQIDTTSKMIVVIRSVGPAGGAINTIDWNDKRLLINQRWSVTLDQTPTKVDLGEERQRSWKTERSPIRQWQGEDGWGYARLELSKNTEINLVIEDQNITTPASTTTSSFSSTQAAVKLDLPNQEFVASLNAQVAHIMMGTVKNEFRPGEPTNYPLAWLRDAAYQLVALVRAGQLQAAKELATDIAQRDFFGGFGPEADAPGLSIWSLAELAKHLQQPEYDQWLWPHVRRKAEFILKMLTTEVAIHQPVDGPVVPASKKDPQLTLVAEPARNGLIVGRMDHHRPLLFINAVSYRGLLDAASLADRVNQTADARRWRDAATKLQSAWKRAFKPPESKNDRTYISSLWPTWVGSSDKKQLSQGLEARWNRLRDAQGGFKKTPLWTYFDIAEAHQWLFLNQSDRVWKTLNWFWQHQASPGLYTWWEGQGEENTSKRWEDVRGWVNPPHVTPHYWTAAEMLLLQLDMLAYTDITASEPTIVIGAGIPQTWLNQPMSVQNLPIPNGSLNWQWDGKQMQVKLRGTKVTVNLASTFPKDTPLKVDYVVN